MNGKQREDFIKLSTELIKWLCENGHPNMTILITSESAELVEGLLAIHTTEFIKD